MMQIRTLIDFATGDNWEVPLQLYEAYEAACRQFPLGELQQADVTKIQFWLKTLSKEDRAQVLRK